MNNYPPQQQPSQPLHPSQYPQQPAQTQPAHPYYSPQQPPSVPQNPNQLSRPLAPYQQQQMSHQQRRYPSPPRRQRSAKSQRAIRSSIFAMIGFGITTIIGLVFWPCSVVSFMLFILFTILLIFELRAE